MTPFRPAVESLDARTLPSAVFAAPEGGGTVRVADHDGAGEGFVHTSAKVVVQDFHFTATVSKSSPILH